jgi:hypothetical protein
MDFMDLAQAQMATALALPKTGNAAKIAAMAEAAAQAQKAMGLSGAERDAETAFASRLLARALALPDTNPAREAAVKDASEEIATALDATEQL